MAKPYSQGSKSNSVLFGTAEPTAQTVGELYQRATDKDKVTHHLCREGDSSRPPQGRSGEPRKGLRHDMLTERGCLAFALPYSKVEDNIKVCALIGGRSLFLLQKAAMGAYRSISGDCFIEGFENGKAFEVSRKLGLELEDICLV